MAETKGVGRLLPYEQTDYEEKITSFKQRVMEQVEVLKVGIKNGSVNDPKISERYIKKIELFFLSPFFGVAENFNKRVKDLKKYLKVAVAEEKEIQAIIEKWLLRKRNNKILVANSYSIKDDSYGNFFYKYEIEKFYDQDLEFLYGILPTYKSELILLNKIKGLLADKKFLESLGAKNSWKVNTLKSALSEWALDFPFGVEFELKELYELPFFKSKKYLDMDLRDFKEVIDNRTKTLENIIKWIETQIKETSAAKNELEGKQFYNNNIYDLFKVFDEFIEKYSGIKEVYRELYSLHRFGQGLIENDIFETLYK
ncbi:MAG: hypothetical protein IKR04_07870 [Clostridia bacterium]|nr:hypothetical protein [Clostridia bacterium]